MNDQDNSETLRSYLNELLDTVDAQLREPYSDVLKREVEMRFCRTCRAKFGGPTPSGFAPPEEAAKTLMRKAAGTKRSIPSAEIWRTQSDLKQRLQEMYTVLIREMVGAHQASPIDVGATVVVGVPPEDIVRSVLWWRVSADPLVIERMKEAMLPAGASQTFEGFRKEFVDLCSRRNVTSVPEALKLLEEQAKAYIERYYH